MFMVRLKFASILHHFSTVAKHRRVPAKYKSLAIGKAQQAITDYLHTTRSISYSHAENIASNATLSIRNLIVKLDFSVPTFSNSLRKHLSYNPINEFEFFFESIGIDYNEVRGYLPRRKFFFSEDRSVLDAACALSGFGFPWNKLGKLYKEENMVFQRSPEEINTRLLKLKDVGFSTVALIGICLAIPRILCGGTELGEEIHSLFAKLRRVFDEFDSQHFVEENVDSWYAISRKLRIFYDLGSENEEMWELIGRNKQLFVEYPEQVLMKTAEYFCGFGVRKEDVAILILRCPVIMDFDLEKPVISVTGILTHFGLNKDELEVVAKKYPYVFGRNKMANLPNVLKALDLHDRIFDSLKNGSHNLLATYSLMDPHDDLDREYQEYLEEIQNSRTPTHTLQKLDFLHGIGFGQNSLTIKVLTHVHGTANELQDRFQVLIDSDINFSKICKLVRSAPKILNQKPHSIKDKLRFLCGEMGNSLDYLEIFPAYLCFDLQYRINPRFRFHKWLVEKGLSKKSYSTASIVATSEKTFLARLYGIHPAILKHWFERFSCKKSR